MALLYLDSCIFIAAYEARGEAADASRRLLRAIEGRGLAVTSEITLAELLAPIARPGAATLERRRAMYMPLLEDETLIGLVPVSRKIQLETIEIRAAYSHRLPDAIHVATACARRCSHFVSCDRDAKRIPPLLAWVTPAQLDFAELVRGGHDA